MSGVLESARLGHDCEADESTGSSINYNLSAYFAAFGESMVAGLLPTLRKKFGSAINAHFGLYAAMTALWHSNIATTAGYYSHG